MTSSVQNVLASHARYIGDAMLFINTDASWSIGGDTNALSKITFGDFTSIDDDTFGFSAVAAEPDGHGGYLLFVRSDLDYHTVIRVGIDAGGRADAASVKVLSLSELYAAEDQYLVDLNDNGGYGSDSVLLEGGEVNLYIGGNGEYMAGLSAGSAVTLKLGGAALTDVLLPSGWELIEVLPAATGFLAYAESEDGNVFGAVFDALGEYTSGAMLTAAELDALELEYGVDIDDDADHPAPAGWTSLLKDDALRAAVEAALADQPGESLRAPAMGSATLSATTAGNVISHAELVKMMKGIISAHKAAGDTPISADEVKDLQALAARGKAVFAGNEGSVADYLTYVLAKMVGNSDANRFFTGGEVKTSELGSLSTDTSIAHFEKLVSKWLLGGDMPAPVTAGDTATGNAQSVTAAYVKADGPLFVDGVSITDVAQGTAGDCYMIAVLAGLAGTAPTAIEAAVVENPAVDGLRSWGVRFFDSQGASHWVTVNDMLPVAPAATDKVAFAGSADKALSGEIWVSLIEKAYAQANSLGIFPRNEAAGKNTYRDIEGGNGEALGQLMAGKVVAFWDNARDRNDAAATAALEKALSDASNAGKLIWVGVSTTIKDSFGNQLLVGGHAHYAIDANRDDASNSTVLVYNPWGLVNLPNPPGPTEGNYLSPAPYTLAELVGMPGVDFAILEPQLG